jgi:hypothetical protein
LAEVLEVEEPQCCKLLHSNAKLVVRKLLVSKDINIEAERFVALEAITSQPVKTQ